ncbi:MAG: FoF1 ATP synthase subunit delta [Kiritimatiellia bacterium]
MYNDEETARPYARALVSAAQDLGLLDRICGDIEALNAQWQGSKELRDWCNSFHSLPRAGHREAIDCLWGDTMAPQTIVMLEALSVNGLLSTIPLIVRVFRRFADGALGRVKVSFSFATAPSAETLALLTARAKETYGPLTEIKTAIEPRLTAGMIIRAGNKQIDGSLAGRLRRLRNAFVHVE